MQKVHSQEAGGDIYRYDEGEAVLKEGQGSSVIYILMKGRLGIYKGEVKITELAGSGIVFGEMSSILCKPRTTTVKAEMESECLVFPGGIHSIVRKFPSITLKILLTLAERLESMNAQFSALQAKYQSICKELKQLKEAPPPPPITEKPKPSTIASTVDIREKFTPPTPVQQSEAETFADGDTLGRKKKRTYNI
jgi:CRP-like cAMP-binding protein